MVAAGHWRAETEEEKKSTWEESVRLRERMFWTRVGGGVVPSFVPLRDGGSPHSPTFTSDDIKQQQQREERMSEEESIISFEPRDITASGSAASTMGNESPRRKSEDDPFQSKSGEDKAKRISIGNTVLSTRSDDNAVAQELGSTTPPPPAEQEAKGNDEKNEPLPIPSLTIEEEKKIEQDAEAQLQDEVKKSLEKPALQRQRSSSNPPPVAATLQQSRKKEESSNRLSLRIPGSMGTGMSMPGAFD